MKGPEVVHKQAQSNQREEEKLAAVMFLNLNLHPKEVKPVLPATKMTSHQMDLCLRNLRNR